MGAEKITYLICGSKLGKLEREDKEMVVKVTKMERERE